MNSKRKGGAGERELCDILTAAGFPAHRNDQRFIGGIDNPDIDAEGLERFHAEVKRVERLNISAAFAQASRDCAGRVPIVMHRRNREPWLVTMKLDDWLQEVSCEDRGRREVGCRGGGESSVGVDRRD